MERYYVKRKQDGEFKKISILDEPIAFIKTWITMKKVSMKLSHKWFGIVMYPNGKMVFRNQKVIDFVDGCIKKNSKEDK